MILPRARILAKMKLRQAKRDRKDRDAILGKLPRVPGRYRCGLCGGIGHNRATCANRPKSKKGAAEQ